MKKITLLFTMMFVAFAYGQGLETFDNAEIGGSYTDGSFIGEGGFEWTYVHSRDQGDFPIDGNGIMLRRSDEPSSLSATIQGGIGNFSVDTRKAFTGNNQRILELYINGDLIETFEPAFGEGGDETVIPFEVENIDAEGEFTLELRIGGDPGNRQIILDNLAWTAPNLSINDNNKLSLNIYPNPVRSGLVTIKTNNNQPLQVAVFDVLGKQVISRTISNNTLNVSSLKAGIYLVQVTENNTTSTKKLIVN